MVVELFDGAHQVGDLPTELSHLVAQRPNLVAVRGRAERESEHATSDGIALPYLSCLCLVAAGGPMA